MCNVMDNNNAGAPKRAAKEIIGFRPAELKPLLNLWLERNPYIDITVLLKQSLKANPELRKLAGKRFAHLVA